MHEPQLGPSTSGSVVLEIGQDVGALVLHTPPELDGVEIEISPATQPDGRTHSQVRQRVLPSGVEFAAVYPNLAAGEYTIWRDATTPAITVAVEGGRVASAFFSTRQR